MAAINWSSSAYRGAPGDSLGAWQYRAAGSIAARSTEERDELALEIGRRCYESIRAGVQTCIWHEAALLQAERTGQPVRCHCQACAPGGTRGYAT